MLCCLLKSAITILCLCILGAQFLCLNSVDFAGSKFCYLHEENNPQAGGAASVDGPESGQCRKGLQDRLRPENMILLAGDLVSAGSLLQVKKDYEPDVLVRQDCRPNGKTLRSADADSKQAFNHSCHQ